MPTFADRGRRVFSATDPYVRILGFLDWIRYFFFQVAPQLYSEAEWGPFQTHYFSENLVALGIELGLLDLQSGTLATTPERRSKALVQQTKCRPTELSITQPQENVLTHK
jgi:hypothetical protein